MYARGRLKFRVKQIGRMAFFLDETVMGFAFPKQAHAALVASEPDKVGLPSSSDLSFNRVHGHLPALDPSEPRELIVDAWRRVVPKKPSHAYAVLHPHGPG